jgi:hypothetical protein
VCVYIADVQSLKDGPGRKLLLFRGTCNSNSGLDQVTINGHQAIRHNNRGGVMEAKVYVMHNWILGYRYSIAMAL